MTYAKSRDTIDSILEAARALFVVKNYANVKIADIAAQANVSTGALYHHFRSKEDVYLQMMHHYLREIRTAILAATEDSAGSCRERLHQSNIAFLQLPDELPPVLRLVRRDINVFADPMRRELIRAYQSAIPQPLETIIRDAILNGELRPCDPRLLSWELVAIVEVALVPYSRSVIGDPEDISNFVLDLLMDGMATHSQSDVAAVPSGAV
jgi:TetR/AcrR family transcriptional regulator of autoinduction and epiphytic fitness